VGFSALIADSIFSSDGVFADPPGFMCAAIDAVHRAKGLFIADEVQCGFGRTGAAMWGFERHGLTPDIVTLGKPMGNGLPVGAVVTRPEILTALCSEVGYFNTFGGSPVAAAAGWAVLDVIEREGLLENARRVGGSLRQSLEALSVRHRAIADVRGAGLYLGVELVKAGESAGSAAAEELAETEGTSAPARAPTPAPEFARAVINGLRERRVLIGAAGKFGNVLKIRPPLCFSMANAEQLIAALDEVMTAESGRA
jgi:4-aminobutyrate aminotransferase-like enzyme